MTGGHLGRRKTAAAIQARAYWPPWSSDLDDFLRRCEPCARYHRGKVKPQAKLRPFPAGEPWERVSIDITGPHPRSSRQNQYILTCIDSFSKWAEAIPLKNQTAPTVARALMPHVFSRFGALQQLLSDRGPEFQSELFTYLMKWMEVDKLSTSPYQPTTNGEVERFHRTLNSMLGKVIMDSQRDWDDRLPMVLAAYRASPHESTGYSPNRLCLGREVRMPLDLIMGLPLEERESHGTADVFVRDMQEKSADAYALARKHLGIAAERRKTAYDIRTREAKFEVGDWVWYWYPRKYRSKSLKWQKCYIGPYLITHKIEPVNYVLQKSAKAKPFVVHLNKLKKCHGTTPMSWLGLSNDDVRTSEGEVGRDDGPVPGVLRLPAQTGISDFNSDVSCDDDSLPAVQKLPARRRSRPKRLVDYVC